MHAVKYLWKTDPIGFVALYLWPMILGSGLFAYGVTAPPGGLFVGWRESTGALSAMPLAAMITGVLVFTTGFTVNEKLRLVGVTFTTITCLGRCATLLLVGSPEITRPRELGSSAIFGCLWFASVLLAFISTPAWAKVRAIHDKAG